MQSPFALDTERALRTHSSFTLSALAVSARRVVDGKVAQSHVSAPAQLRNKVTGEVREVPREYHRLPCVHCGQSSVIRTSTQVTRLTREYVFCCTNPECGHTFVALMEVVRTLSPSATPDPSVSLPLSAHVRRDLVRAQLDNAAQAEHKTCFTRPVTGDLFQGLPPPNASV